MSSKIQSYNHQRGLKISTDIKKISTDIYPLYLRIFACLTSKVHNKITTNSQQNVPQNFCCLTHKKILMCLSLTLSYKYHDIQPISFSYSFLASSLHIPDKCGNATVASILLFLEKTSNQENLRFDETCQSETVLYNPPDLRLLATLVWSLTLSLANSFFSSEALSTVQSAERSIFRVILDCSLERKYEIHHIIT